MPKIIPLPYKVLIAVVLCVAIFLWGMAVGYHNYEVRAQVVAAKDKANYIEYLNAQEVRNSELTDKLAKAKAAIVTKTVEVIKYVPQVTTGRPCLSPDAVSLLQPGNSPSFRAPTSVPNAASPNASASDTDIAYWIADANRLYEICAEQMNSVVDWGEAK